MQYDGGPLDGRPMKIEMFGTPPPQDKPQPAVAKPRPCKWSELLDLAIRAWVNLLRGVVAVGRPSTTPPTPTNPTLLRT